MLVNKHILMNEAGAEPASGGASAAATTAAPAQAADGQATTAVTAEPKPTSTPAAWPEDWRARFSNEDEKRANIAARFTSPEAAFEAFIQAQDKIRSGNLKEVKPFPDQGTPEEQAAWRKDNGLPESHDKYNLDGLVIGENDKPFVDEFMKEALAANMNDKQVSKALDWYFKSQEKQIQAQEEKDRNTAQEVQESLRKEWGAEFNANKKRIESILGIAPEGVKDRLLNARFADGTAVFNDPNVLRFFAGLHMQIDPMPTLVGTGTGSQVDQIADEIGKLEKMMGNRLSDYWKGPLAEKNQERYRQLKTAQQKLSSR
jgi:hypothetical protein